jgi:dsRNA-specific ribonuclease/ERCC4-related helicase
MTPSRPLSEQQCRVIQQHLPAYHVKSLTGADDVDKWTDKNLWDAFLTGVHVVVGTPAVLADALTHAFVSISDLSLCIFDETHHCARKDPMNNIMQHFYHPAKRRGESIPHILGLSASPVQNRNASKSGLAAVETNLDAITVTPKRFVEDLETHVHLPEIITVDYDENVPVPGKGSLVCDKLLQEVTGYELEQDPYVVELKDQNDQQAKRLLMKVYEKGKTYCTEQLQTLLNRSGHIDTQLGNFVAEWYVCTCLRRYLEGRQNGSSLIDDLESRERRHLESIIGRILSVSDDTGRSRPDITGASDKAKALHDILLQNAKTGLRSIVFVEQRAMVVALAHMLQTPALSNLYNIGTFVGNSGHSSRKTTLYDLVDLRTQDQDLQAFRDGKKNLMIATNVLEEGIDIPACNGVICFDLPKNLISFVQRKGRAREAESKYILFVARGDLDADPSKWRKLEEKMKEAYMDETRSADTMAGVEAEAGEEDTSSVRYSVPSTGALLTMENARAHLHHFCAVARQASRYVDPRPEFDTQELAENMWAASVTLPSFVHSSVRTAKSSVAWRGERNAIKEAAFNAYVALHQAELVNDHLLSAVKDLGPKPGEEHADQPSLLEVDEQLSAWRLCVSTGLHQPVTWYAADIRLRLSGREMLSQTLWLPFRIEIAENIRLYWNADVCYEASVHPLPRETFDNDERVRANAWTSLILRSVFASRMPIDNGDFAFLLSRPSNQPENDFLGPYTGHDAICERLASTHNFTDCGMVRVADQIGRVFILQGLEDVSVEQSPGSGQTVLEKHLVVTPFPKRRDFLHVVSKNDQVSTAYTARQLFAVSKCTIDRLPVDYSLLGVFLPSILHHLDTAFVARHLSTGILSKVGIDDVTLILEALSAPVAKEQAGDYNRLEYLGDCILKFCTELQVVAQRPLWPEGFLSREKDRIVRNSNLADAALDIGLAQFIFTKPFTGSKWRPSHLKEMATSEVGKREVSSKVLADVVESLIGAAYVDGGLQKAFACIQTLLPKEEWWTHDAALDAVLEESQSTSTNLQLLENLVGHNFNHPSLLLEAITHASHRNGKDHFGLSYERLEFLGDAILDLIVTPRLFAHERKLRHWDLHRIHEALVNGQFLGFCCMTLSGEQETFDVIDTPAAYGIPQKEAKPRTRTYSLHDFIRASDVEFSKAREASIARLNPLRDAIDTALQTSSLYPWPDLIALRPDKSFSDIVESILGALFLDTRGDIEACEAFLEKLGVLPILRRILDGGMETTFPKERVGILADRKDVKYVAKTDEGVWECAVVVDQSEVVKVAGYGSREEAEVRAADMAAAKLGENVGVGGNRKKRKLAVRGEDRLGYA